MICLPIPFTQVGDSEYTVVKFCTENNEGFESEPIWDKTLPIHEWHGISGKKIYDVFLLSWAYYVAFKMDSLDNMSHKQI